MIPGTDIIQSSPTSGFRAESNDGIGIHSGTNTDNFTGIGEIQIIAKPGFVLDSIDVAELGDYRMTSDALSVDVDGQLIVWDYANSLFGPTEIDYLTITGDLTIKDEQLHSWRGDGGFDLTTSTWDDIDHVGLKLQNNLSATSADITGSSAWIMKKIIAGGIGVSIDPSEIPVPAAIWLFGSGLLGLAGVARRRT